MACEYYSRVVFEQFTDGKILEKAINRLDKERRVLRDSYRLNGLTVEAKYNWQIDELKQAYQTESAKAALKKKGFFVTEKRNTETGKIKLTVRA